MVGAAVGAGGLPGDVRTYYLEQSGAYDTELAELASISPRLGQNELATFEALRGSAAAATLAEARTVLAEPRDADAASGAAPPVAVAAHDGAATELVDGLHRLGTEELRQGDAKDQEQAADQVRTAVLLGTLLRTVPRRRRRRCRATGPPLRSSPAAPLPEPPGTRPPSRSQSTRLGPSCRNGGGWTTSSLSCPTDPLRPARRATNQPPVPTAAPADVDEGARRARHALGALQRGTRDARRSDEGRERDSGEETR